MSARGWFAASGSGFAALGSGPTPGRLVAWLGGTFIAIVVALAAYDIVRGYHTTVEETRVALDTQSRVIAEQTARSVQAVDTVLRHLVEQHRRGLLDRLDAEALYAYLQEQKIGLVQVDGLAIFNVDGSARAATMLPPSQLDKFNAAKMPAFQRLREDSGAGLTIGTTFLSSGTGRYIFPIGRRLQNAQGELAGVVGAGGRVDYFQSFYRDAYPDPGTRIALLYRDGTLLARHPPAEASLGKRMEALEPLLPAGDETATSTRGLSPVDGSDRFASIRLVPDYPLVVVVTRDASAALAPWRTQATGSALRTLALATFAAWLIALAVRHLARLRVSEERYALAMSAINEGHWLWNIPEQRVYVSAKLAELFGFAGGAQEMVDAEYFARIPVHPEDAGRVHDNRNKHVEGLSPRLDHQFRIVDRATGVVRWVHTRAQCFRDDAGMPVRLAGSTVDVTQRKRAEEALRVSEERYQLAVDGSNEGLWDWDLPSDMLFLSPRAQQLMFTGATEPATRPRREWIDLTVYHPDDTAAVRRELVAHLHGETPHYSVEYRLQHHSGQWRWYRQRGIAVRDADGRPQRMAGSMEDISVRKDAEAERAHLERQLRQAQKLEAIGTLAGGIAHDFNNILSAILGYGEMVQRDAGDGTPMRRHIDAAMSAGMRAKSLVERILAFSRGGVAERVPVHVPSAVDEALAGISASLPAGVRLERRCTAEDAGVLGDATQIHQVVMNLCANAVHAMRSGGVLTLVIDAVQVEAPRLVATSTLPAGHYVCLAVGDTGSGITPQVLERIFDPFFTTKEVGVGTGLGLSLVHGIVADLGGGIAVDSRLGHGTTFSVYLPWHSYVAAPAQAVERVVHGDGETVLFIDDEESLVRLGEEMLAELGYEPVGFASSLAALEAFREEPDRFDAVLTDEAMPGLTGLELIAEIRRLRPALPIVLMSGFVDAAVANRARDAGVADVLTKPLVSRDIARSLAGALPRQAERADEAAF